MSRRYVKPETGLRNALNKADGLLKVSKPKVAIEVLFEALSMRRWKTWCKVHEDIILLYLKVAVSLRKNARDAIKEYRFICTNHSSSPTSVMSLQKVVGVFLDTVERRLDEAKAEADKAGEDGKNVADLEETPESISLMAVNGEDVEARVDRQILTPWLKYAMQAYTTLLYEMKRKMLLQQYHQTVRRAFAFCIKFERKSEFRKLCDQLRRDRQNLVKYGGGSNNNSFDLQLPETQTAYLNTRIMQLEIASKLELWKQAYATIEDIRDDSKAVATRTVRSEEFMLAYFDRLAQIFWKSGNYLFHAYTLEKRYSLATRVLQLSPEQRKRMASAVVMATIAIPQSEEAMSAGVFSAENEENMRLADCLGFKKEVPTRRNLVQGIEQTGILSAAGETTQKIYKMLENSTAPLSLTARIEALFKKVQDQQDKETAAREEIKEKKAAEPDGDGGDDAKDGESAEKSSSEGSSSSCANASSQTHHQGASEGGHHHGRRHQSASEGGRHHGRRHQSASEGGRRLG